MKTKYNKQAKTKSGQGASESTQLKNQKVWKFYDRIAEIYDKYDDEVSVPVDNIIVLSNILVNNDVNFQADETENNLVELEEITTAESEILSNRFYDPMERILLKYQNTDEEEPRSQSENNSLLINTPKPSVVSCARI